MANTRCPSQPRISSRPGRTSPAPFRPLAKRRSPLLPGVRWLGQEEDVGEASSLMLRRDCKSRRPLDYPSARTSKSSGGLEKRFSTPSRNCVAFLNVLQFYFPGAARVLCGDGPTQLAMTGRSFQRVYPSAYASHCGGSFWWTWRVQSRMASQSRKSPSDTFIAFDIVLAGKDNLL